MQFSSTIQIVKMETQLSKKLNPDTNKPFESHFARAILLDDDGAVATLGRLRIPRDLVGIAKEGSYRASFGLTVPDYGDQKGDIVAALTGLLPVTVGRTPSAAVKADPSKV